MLIESTERFPGAPKRATGLAGNRVAAQVRARIERDELADQSVLFNVVVEGDCGERITIAAESRENADRLARELNRVAWIEVAR